MYYFCQFLKLTLAGQGANPFILALEKHFFIKIHADSLTKNTKIQKMRLTTLNLQLSTLHPLSRQLSTESVRSEFAKRRWLRSAPSRAMALSRTRDALRRAEESLYVDEMRTELWPKAKFSAKIGQNRRR